MFNPLTLSWAILAVTGLVGCSRSNAPPRPNILLITLDTTRADHIGAYGCALARTPVLDSLAERGVLFERAYAPAPLTLPSHASMMTGLYPAEHGLRTNGMGRLPAERVTVSELLQQAGYETGAFVASYVLDDVFGLSQGFDVYDDDLRGAEPTQDSIHRFRDGKLVVDAASAWLNQDRSAPSFCWVHLYDPHAPYESHEAEFGPAFRDAPYDGEIAYTDQLVGRLLAVAEKFPSTVIIVVGDHGEGLGEHSELQHGYTLYHSVLHVPLIVQGFPDSQGGRRVSEAVSLVDVFSTLLEAAQVPVPPEISGQSFAAALRGKPFASRPCYAMTDDPFLQNGWSPLRSLTTDRWHYIRTSQPELYDLEKDPAELTNLAESEPDQLADCERQLSDLEATQLVGEASAIQLSDAERRALASLGYVGGTRPSTPSAADDLPDVKVMLPFNVATQSALKMIEQGRLDEAETLLEQVVSESPPEHYASRIALASVYEGSGRWKDAERIYDAALKLRPDSTDALYPLGGLYAEHGRFAEAIEVYERCQDLQPDSAQPFYNLGLVRARLGELDLAQQDLEETLQRDGSYVGAWVALGNVYARQGRVSEAVAAYESELAFNPSSVEGHVNLAVQLVNLSQLDDARRHLEEAVRLAPASFEAQFNLGVCCELAGDRAAAIQHLETALRLQPDHAGAKARLNSLQATAPAE